MNAFFKSPPGIPVNSSIISLAIVYTLMLLSCQNTAVREWSPANAVKNVAVTRSVHNPLITPQSNKNIGTNINGPSVIRVPSWIEKPLGRYYMYFAHHTGKHIRLAYADTLHGPWTVYEPGTLQLDEAKAFGKHIASPDVHVDNEKRQIRMYFHGPAREKKGQWTGVAFSSDGIKFTASDYILGKSYFRVFKWKDYYYAIAKNRGFGELFRSKDGITPFEKRSNFIPRMRHAAIFLKDEYLLIFYSRKGDAPERILMLTVRLSNDWNDWIPSEPIDIIKPETDYEGIQYSIKPSRSGLATKVCQLRDPAIFEENGKIYLFYSIAGEMGIAMAELTFTVDK